MIASRPLPMDGLRDGRVTPGPGAWRRSLCALACLLLILAACSRGPPDLNAPEVPLPVPADYPQLFRTQGNQILDGRGQARLLRGVAVPEALWLDRRQDDQIGYFDRRLFRAAAEWRAEVVRISILPALYRRHGPEETMRVIDWSVAYARRYGLYIILCFHSIGYPPDETYKSLTDWRYGELYQTSQAEIAEFWTRMARRYRDEPAIAFYELFNEPVRQSAPGVFTYNSSEEDWSRLRDWAEGLTDRIRAIDPNKPIIMGGLEFGYNLRHAPANPVRRPNIAYATHPYAGSEWNVSWQDAFLTPARALPVIATEFGWGGTHGEGVHRGPGRYRDDVLAAFDRAGIGWTAWSFSHTFPPSLLADARSFQPSPEYGQVIRQALIDRSGQRALVAAPPPPVRLAAAALLLAIEGNTEEGGWGAIHYRPGGQMVAGHGGERFPGAWRVTPEGLMCQTFPHIRDGRETCFEWFLDGERLTTRSTSSGEGEPDGLNRIRRGNPLGL